MTASSHHIMKNKYQLCVLCGFSFTCQPQKKEVAMMRSKSIFRVWIAASLFLVLVFPLSAASQNKTITPEMVVSMERVSQVSLDPTGKWIAYGLGVPRGEKDERGGSFSEIWVVPYDGGEQRQYTSKPISAWSVSWSPDGKLITFLSRRTEQDAHTQVYQMRLDGGEAMPLTHHESSVSSYQWSPDGKMIAFTSTDPATSEEKAAKKAGRDWKVYDENYKHRRLWIMDVVSADTRQVFDKDLTVRSFAWAPDSKSLAFQGTDTPLIDDSYMFRKIYTVSANGGSPEALCDTKGKLGAMKFSPDGSMLAFAGAVSLNDPISQSLFVVSAEGGNPRNLTEDYEATAGGFDWLDNKTLLLRSVEGTHSTLNRVDAKSGKMKPVAGAGPILQSLSARPETGRFAAVVHSPEHPQEVFSGKLKDGKLTRLTWHNPDLKTVQLARQEVIEWKADDGLTIEGILTYPLNYKEGRRYPLALQIHGGPEGISLNGWNTRSGYPVQVLAANGYMVLEPNYRGSGGRGVAFSKADHDDLGGKEFDDVLAGVDALIERGLVDTDRVGTGGWSYGGYFSAWAATKHSKRFKASVVAAGISNWMSFTGTTDIPYEMSLVHWNSWWFDEPELHWKRSPLYHINNAKTPTLVVHGASDARVHPGQGIELYTALRIKDVPTKLVLYPRQPHGLRERAHQLDFIQRVVEWFDRYLKEVATN
jgi:dipeptidyl aminopeptidase/acylaminoacyl peptidase